MSTPMKPRVSSPSRKEESLSKKRSVSNPKKSYIDYAGPEDGDRRIVAHIKSPKDLFLVDTAIEAFIDHINNTIGISQKDWNIEINLTMVTQPFDPDIASEN